MIILGMLLLLGAVGLAAAAIWANPGLFEGSIGAVELFGYSAELTVGEVFLTGAALGVLALLGIVMMGKGAGRRARRRAAARRRLHEQQQELRAREQELEALRKQEAAAAATATADTTTDTTADTTQAQEPKRRFGRHARRDEEEVSAREEVSANR